MTTWTDAPENVYKIRNDHVWLVDRNGERAGPFLVEHAESVSSRTLGAFGTEVFVRLRSDRSTPDAEPGARPDAAPADDRPVALPLLGGGLLLTSEVVEVGDEARTYGTDAAGVCTQVRSDGGRMVPLPRAAVVAALGWRAVDAHQDRKYDFDRVALP